MFPRRFWSDCACSGHTKMALVILLTVMRCSGWSTRRQRVLGTSLLLLVLYCLPHLVPSTHVLCSQVTRTHVALHMCDTTGRSRPEWRPRGQTTKVMTCCRLWHHSNPNQRLWARHVPGLLGQRVGVVAVPNDLQPNVHTKVGHAP